mgnify:FL=1
MSQLRKAMQYYFEKEDYEFILELCKVGHVHTFSNQIEIIAEKSLSFKEYPKDSEQHTPGLILPKKWAIEGIYSH